MELWIRSQDKRRLIKVYDIFRNNSNQIECNESADYIIILGKYKTAKRAEEVLNEIQRLIQPIISFNPIIKEEIQPEYTNRHYICSGMQSSIEQLDTWVYQMPER